MNKLTAHLVLVLLDIAALAACYYAIAVWQQINTSVTTNSDVITYQAQFGFYLITILMPLTHVLGSIKWKPGTARWINLSLVAILITISIAAYFLNSDTEKRLLAAGYHYCKDKSETMTFSEFKTFIKNDAICSDQ